MYRSEAVNAIKNNCEILITSIENICKDCSVLDMSATGISLLNLLETFYFIFGIHMMNSILMLILKVSATLQEPKLNLVLAMQNIKFLRYTLLHMRYDDSKYKQMLDSSEILCMILIF